MSIWPVSGLYLLGKKSLGSWLANEGFLVIVGSGLPTFFARFTALKYSLLVFFTFSFAALFTKSNLLLGAVSGADD